jgi:ankyrin repeat protein
MRKHERGIAEKLKQGEKAIDFLDVLLLKATTGDPKPKELPIPNVMQMEALLDNGASVNARNTHKATPLHIAARSTKLEAVELLFRHGADKEARNFLGATPLHNACREGSPEIVAYLIEQGCKIDAVTLEIETPLHQAVHRDRLEIISMLVKHGADTRIKSNRGGREQVATQVQCKPETKKFLGDAIRDAIDEAYKEKTMELYRHTTY